VVLTVVTAVVGAVVAAVLTRESLLGLVDRAQGGTHLTYTLERHFPTTAIDDAWALPADVTAEQEAAMPQAGPDFHKWVLAEGGVQVGSHVTRIEFTNPRERQVRINSIRGRVVDSQPAWDGSLFCEYSEGTGEVTVVEINLGDQDPVARVANGRGTGSSYFLSNGDITLAKNETHSLVVTARPPPGRWAEWHLEVRYTVDGEPATLVIDDNGSPFTISGYADDYQTYLVRAGKHEFDHDWQKEDGWYERSPGQCRSR